MHLYWNRIFFLKSENINFWKEKIEFGEFGYFEVKNIFNFWSQFLFLHLFVSKNNDLCSNLVRQWFGWPNLQVRPNHRTSPNHWVRPNAEPNHNGSVDHYVAVAHGVLFACVTVVKATQKNSRIAALPTWQIFNSQSSSRKMPAVLHKAFTKAFGSSCFNSCDSTTDWTDSIEHHSH